MNCEENYDVFNGKTFVIKYGGSIMKNEAAKKAFVEDVVFMKSLGINIIIVHGGGPEINKWLDRAGVESHFEKGLRVTDEAVMEIVEMVLSGKVNKNLSSQISTAGLKSIGLSGRDNKLIKAEKKYLYDEGKKIDIGYVGEVTGINVDFLKSIVENDIVPVISPLGCDDSGNCYNINADYAASNISSTLKAEKLIILTDVEGVYTDINNPDTLISKITVTETKKYINDGIINGGMIPKMECCIKAIENGTKNVQLLDGRNLHCLKNSLNSKNGTTIIA